MEDVFCWSFCSVLFWWGRFFGHSAWLAADLSSLTRDFSRTRSLQLNHGVLTTGPPENSVYSGLKEALDSAWVRSCLWLTQHCHCCHRPAFSQGGSLFHLSDFLTPWESLNHEANPWFRDYSVACKLNLVGERSWQAQCAMSLWDQKWKRNYNSFSSPLENNTRQHMLGNRRPACD